MANTIALAKKYLPLLDEAYKKASVTSILDAPQELVRESINAKEILIPKTVLQGLGDYSRSTGYVTGDVTFSWETHTFTQDRGRSFQVDDQDNLETVELAFGTLAGEFIRNHVVPEVDAYRFATMAAKTAVGNIATPATLSKTTAMQAIDTGLEKLYDGEVDENTAVLFVSAEVYTYLKQSDLIVRNIDVQASNGTINRTIETLDNGIPVIRVPRNRFYTAIDLNSGGVGEEVGGYAKAAAGKDINFMIVDKRAVLPVVKTALPRIFDPMTNQSANAWKYDYRLYHDIFVPSNKTKGIYLHNKA
jgi:hypothetical protein